MLGTNSSELLRALAGSEIRVAGSEERKPVAASGKVVLLDEGLGGIFADLRNAGASLNSAVRDMNIFAKKRDTRTHENKLAYGPATTAIGLCAERLSASLPDIETIASRDPFPLGFDRHGGTHRKTSQIVLPVDEATVRLVAGNCAALGTDASKLMRILATSPLRHMRAALDGGCAHGALVRAKDVHALVVEVIRQQTNVAQARRASEAVILSGRLMYVGHGFLADELDAAADMFDDASSRLLDSIEEVRRTCLDRLSGKGAEGA